MLNLPQTTEFNKRLPKKKFYEQLEVAPEIKRIFVEQIKNIIWRNKIATSTVNVAAGEKVTEIEVFEVQLNEQYLDESVLKLIDQGIPYTLFSYFIMKSRFKSGLPSKKQKIRKIPNIESKRTIIQTGC